MAVASGLVAGSHKMEQSISEVDRKFRFSRATNARLYPENKEFREHEVSDNVSREKEFAGLGSFTTQLNLFTR